MIMTLRKIFCMLSCMLTVSACGGETPVPGPNEGNQGGNEGGGEGSGPAYYISYSRGSDSNPGTSPDAPGKPWTGSIGEHSNRATASCSNRAIPGTA